MGQSTHVNGVCTQKDHVGGMLKWLFGRITRGYIHIFFNSPLFILTLQLK